MSGNKRSGIVLQPRDERLLAELGVMRIIDREAAKVVGGFGSTTRANTRLLALTRAGLLKRFFAGSVAHGRKSIYTLSGKGAELVSAKLDGIDRPADRLVVGDRFIDHQAGINEIYLAVKYRKSSHGEFHVGRWLSFRQSLSPAIKITPDAYFEVAVNETTRAMFLEVDMGTEALSVWKTKAAYYLQLAISGEFSSRFHRPQFRVLVVAGSAKRLSNIRKVAANCTDKIFWFTTFESINRDGFWSPIWLRPTGEQRHSLL